MAKNRPPRIRDHPLRVIQSHLERKAMRQGPTRPHPMDEPLYSRRGSSNLHGPTPSRPQVHTTSIPLTSIASVYGAGFWYQGDTDDNFPGVFSGGNGGQGVEGGSFLRIIADNEGLHKDYATKLLPNDTGQFDVWLRGLTSGSGALYEYVLSVHQSDGAETPISEESLVIRWESGTGSGSGVLRLYPDLANYSGTYVEIDLPQATWWQAIWHQIRATWSYQDQLWTLWWDDTEGTLVNPSTVSWPEWGGGTQLELFTDLNGANVIYHDVQFAAFGLTPYLWKKISSQSGSTIADSPTDTLNIIGARGNQTSIIGDTLTITAPAGITFYFDDEADLTGIGGYKRWRRAIPTGVEATAVQTGKDTDGEMLLGSWVTSFGSPGIEAIPVGEWNWHCYAHVDNATNESHIKFYVYKRNLAGAETALFNVTTADVDDLAVALQHFIYAQADPISLLGTDRLVVKAYFYTTRPADVTMTFTYDGAAHASHVHTPFYSYGAGIAGRISHCVNYDVVNPAATAVILGLRPWQDETVNPPYLLRPEVPRTITVTVIPEPLTTMTGTVTINGIDADGTVIADVITVNAVSPATPTYETNRAFGEITSIVVDQTDVTTLSQYAVGLEDKIGLPNYPFNAAGDVFKITSLGAGFMVVPAIDITYGTVDLAVIIAPERYTIWYRPFK